MRRRRAPRRARQPGRQVEDGHQQVHRRHAVDRQAGRAAGAERHRAGGRRRSRLPSARRSARPPSASPPALRTAGHGVACLPSMSCACSASLAARPPLPAPCGDPRARERRGESDKSDGISMDALITAAGRALASGDPLGALKRVALRDDPPALALRGIAMAQLGDLERARALLRAAARGFGARAPAARARCVLAEAEIALVSRDLGVPMRTLAGGARGPRGAGRPGECRPRGLSRGAPAARSSGGSTRRRRRSPPFRSRRWRPPRGRARGWSPPASRCGASMRPRRRRRSRGRGEAARATGIAGVAAEVERAAAHLAAPAARLGGAAGGRMLSLAEVGALGARGDVVVDACRTVVRSGASTVALASRPVLFVLARALAEAWPGDVGARGADRGRLPRPRGRRVAPGAAPRRDRPAARRARRPRRR